MFHIDTLTTLVAATLTLLLGRKLVQLVPLLKNTLFQNLSPAACWSRLPCCC